jgi:hypothetical protein
MMICQEALDEAKEEEDDAESEERSFSGMAALITSNPDAESNDDSCPSLLAHASADDGSREDNGDSIPKLVGRKHCKSDLDAEVNEGGDSIPGLITRNNLNSDSDVESENENWESEDDHSMPGLVFRPH